MQDSMPHAMYTLGALLISMLLMTSPARAIDSAETKALFADPPREYCTAPLWVWNDLLTEQQIRDTLRDLASQNVRQAFLHPRPGLMTPYLTDEWFRLCEAALDEARRLDMNIWIYDENSYPSGFAGGFVPDAMPESRGRGLALAEVEQPPKADDDLIAVYRMVDEACTNITAEVRAGKEVPKGRYVVARRIWAQPAPWHGGKTYVDLLYPGVTQKFLEITLEPYRKRFGAEFGKRIPGAFTDEPELRPAGGLPWTEDLPKVFQERWGYSLLDHLPSLKLDVDDFKRVRHNYLQVLNDLFIERWGKPYHDYCERNNLEFTGHYWEHEWPNCLMVPDNMAMYAWHQRPAIDNLMNTYSEDLHAQFGNTRTVRELASVANQLGRKRTLCEAYGAGGWDLRFEDMKRIGDWLYVLGVNTLDEHLSYITIRGARKHDHPQSFSYHTSWWPAYHVQANYFARLSAAMSQGQQINDVLLLQPTTTAWMYNSEPGNDPQLAKLGQTFEAMIRAWEAAQVEYDIGSEDLIDRHGSVTGGALVVGKRSYPIIVLPPLTENLNATTLDLLDKFLATGGTVICCGDPPSMVDGQPSDAGAAAAKQRGWKRLTEQQAVAQLVERQAKRGFAVRRAEGDAGWLYHHRRIIDDGEILLLVNTSIENPSRGTLRTSAGGAERWDPHSGSVADYPFRRSSEGIKAAFDLPPCGSLLLFLPKQQREPVAAPTENTVVIAAEAGTQVRRLDPNVLTLDYADVTCAGETKKDFHVIKAGNWLFAKHGLERNPWDRAVQFRDELLKKTFPAESGFEAIYRFTIEGQIPPSLFAVVERADLYTITCNDQPVSAPPGAWWLDKAFGKIDVAAAAKVGENTLTLKARPFTMFHELEPAYILGDFRLKAADRGFVIIPDEPLKLGPWNEQGYPLFGHSVAYEQRFTVDSTQGEFRVALPKWYGSVARIVVNGKEAGYVSCPPWECDVTTAIQPGTNDIKVIVIGTLRNTLGPHHWPHLGSSWPAAWDQAPETGPPAGEKYLTVSYGLFEPFVLKRIRG